MARVRSVWRQCARRVSDGAKARKLPSTSLAMPERGFDGDEAQFTWRELARRAPDILREQARMVADELREIVHPPGGVVEVAPRHGAVLVQWKFDRRSTLDAFVVTADRARNVGYSEATFELTDRWTAVFQGNLDTRVPKDGQVFRTGYAAISSKIIQRAFNRTKTYKLWSLFTHLVLKIRGDGRTYLLNIGTPGYFDVFSHDVYNYPLYTHGGPYWQYARIPFSKFYLSVHGRIQDRQSAVIKGREQFVKDNNIQYFGITLCDKIDGPFALEIDWIGVEYDVSHFERFAYEMFDLAVNPN